MKLQLTHLRLLVSNYSETFLFYRDILGLEVDWGDENTGYAEFNTGFLKLTVLKKEYMNGVVSSSEKSENSDDQDKTALIFAVDDVDTVHEHLKEHNVNIITPPLDRPEWGLRTAHLRDPDGNLIEIYTNLGILN
ncbi:MAG TPA: VOC family protein [Nostocaceae cyanobacterium]|nr:VOC family protein [Nostocaceae cyanobacterium]